MLSIINRLFGRRADPTIGWPRLSLPAPPLLTVRQSLGNLRFGDEIARVRMFGRPDVFSWTGKDYCELIYLAAGFQIDCDHGRFAFASYFLGPDEFLPKGASFSSPCIDSAGVVSASMSINALKDLLGQPRVEEGDEYEILLGYAFNGLVLNFEADVAGKLKRLDVHPV